VFKPRPYQLEAKEHFFRLIQECSQGVAIESPTGTGKSAMMALIAAEASKRGGVLILAHREELVRGNAKAVEQITGERCPVEMNTESRLSAYDWQDIRSNGGIVSASVDTLQGRRLAAIPPDAIKTILVDECHHVIPMSKAGIQAAHCSKYYKVKVHFGNPKWGGFSGTLYRGGKKKGPNGQRQNLMSRCFDKVHRTGSLFWFIDEGWLVDYVPLHLSAVSVHLDFSKLQSKHVSEKEALEVWNTHKFEAMSALRKGLHEHCGTRPTLIFSPQVQHAAWVSEFMNSADPAEYPQAGPDTADYVASYTIGDDGNRQKYPEWRRRSVIDRFNEGKLQWVSNQGVFCEGTDIPPVAALALCRMTESRNLFRQQIGRGGRVLPGTLDGLEEASADARRAAIAASAKPNCLVLDFCGVTQKKEVANLANWSAIYEESPQWGAAQARLADEYLMSEQRKGRSPTVREIRQAIEERSTAWMIGVRAMLQSSSESVVWEATEVDLRNGELSPTAATVNREGVKGRATEKQIAYLLSLQKVAGVTNFPEAEIRSMGSKQVGVLIDKNVSFRNQLQCPTWLFRQLRQKYGVPANRIPLTWGKAFEVKRDLDNGMPVDKLPVISNLKLFA
jgi:superfamily II DNA or RNA helicase